MMQQQMFDQFQQAMGMLVNMFTSMHSEQMEVIREESRPAARAVAGTPGTQGGAGEGARPSGGGRATGAVAEARGGSDPVGDPAAAVTRARRRSARDGRLAGRGRGGPDAIRRDGSRAATDDGPRRADAGRAGSPRVAAPADRPEAGPAPPRRRDHAGRRRLDPPTDRVHPAGAREPAGRRSSRFCRGCPDSASERWSRVRTPGSDIVTSVRCSLRLISTGRNPKTIAGGASPSGIDGRPGRAPGPPLIPRAQPRNP